MSELQDLCTVLSVIDGDLVHMAQELHTKAQLYGRAAANAATAARSVEGAAAIALARTAAAFSSAARHASQAAAGLLAASSEGQAFVKRTMGTGAPAESATAARSAADKPSARYLDPGPQVRSQFQALLHEFGAIHPEGWIAAGNPHYASGLPTWTQNCGPCARSFADAYQGRAMEPALGDGGIPPGEGEEMWQALNRRPASRVVNSGNEPAAFTTSAYRALAAALVGEQPGTVAIVGVDWDVPGIDRGDAGGHWFNAYVEDDGRVMWADEQSGVVGEWPPPYASSIWRLEGLVRSPTGEEWKDLNL